MEVKKDNFFFHVTHPLERVRDKEDRVTGYTEPFQISKSSHMKENYTLMHKQTQIIKTNMPSWATTVFRRYRGKFKKEVFARKEKLG